MSISSNNTIRSNNINKLLFNQGVSIAQDKLNKLLKIKGITFELSITNETSFAYYALIGKPNTRKRKTGVYIFTHIASGKKYVVLAIVFLEDWISIWILIPILAIINLVYYFLWLKRKVFLLLI